MIIHRDYTHHGDSSIKIFNDKIEFYNPGQLPEKISIEKLLKGDYVSEARNKKIAEIFKEAGIIEKYGSGVGRVLRAFEFQKTKMPVFENFQHGFRVTFFSNKTDLKTDLKTAGKTDEVILQLIKNRPEITIPEIAEIINKGLTATKSRINKLKETGLLKRIGPAKGGYWKTK